MLGSDDFPAKEKDLAARDINGALEAGWLGPVIAERVALAEIARAHEWVEQGKIRGRVVVTI